MHEHICYYLVQLEPFGPNVVQTKCICQIHALSDEDYLSQPDDDIYYNEV